MAGLTIGHFLYKSSEDTRIIARADFAKLSKHEAIGTQCRCQASVR